MVRKIRKIRKITDLNNKPTDKKEVYPVELVLYNSKKRLSNYLKQKDYKSALALLAALAQTGLYSPSSYWNVGEEIIRGLDELGPQDLTNYLRATVSGIRKPHNDNNIKEYILQLLSIEEDEVKDRYVKVNDFMLNELYITYKNQEKSPAMAKFFAIISYEDWNINHRANNNNESLKTVKKLLKEAYDMNTNDRYVIKCYLNVLNQELDESDKPTIKQIVQTHLSINSGLIGDPELVAILLHFGEEYVDQLTWKKKICADDPVADPRVAFFPLMFLFEIIPQHDPAYEIFLRLRLNLILDRLEHGCRDPTVIQKLNDYVKYLNQEIPYLQNEIRKILKYRDIFLTLDNLKEDFEIEDEDEDEGKAKDRGRGRGRGKNKGSGRGEDKSKKDQNTDQSKFHIQNTIRSTVNIINEYMKEKIYNPLYRRLDDDQQNQSTKRKRLQPIKMKEPKLKSPLELYYS